MRNGVVQMLIGVRYMSGQKENMIWVHWMQEATGILFKVEWKVSRGVMVVREQVRSFVQTYKRGACGKKLQEEPI